MLIVAIDVAWTENGELGDVTYYKENEAYPYPGEPFSVREFVVGSPTRESLEIIEAELAKMAV